MICSPRHVVLQLSLPFSVLKVNVRLPDGDVSSARRSASFGVIVVGAVSAATQLAANNEKPIRLAVIARLISFSSPVFGQYHGFANHCNWKERINAILQQVAYLGGSGGLSVMQNDEKSGRSSIITCALGGCLD